MTGNSNNSDLPFPANLPFTALKYVTGKRTQMDIIDPEQTVR
jgi:hypothetical protein